MLAISRDAAWCERMRALAARGGWPVLIMGDIPTSRGVVPADCEVIVLDRAAVSGSPARAVAGLRKLFTAARAGLACSEDELGAAGIAAGLSSGADEVIVKSWSEGRLFKCVSALRDAALASVVRVSADGLLKAERRAHRASVRVGGRWMDLELPAAEFTILWALLSAEEKTVSREGLLVELSSASGREVEAETVARRILSLRRALAPWKGGIESVRGGFYRLVSSRRRSTT